MLLLPSLLLSPFLCPLHSLSSQLRKQCWWSAEEKSLQAGSRGLLLLTLPKAPISVGFLGSNVPLVWSFSVWVVCVAGMRHLCWIWFNLWVQSLLPNLSPIPPEKPGPGITVLADSALENQPGTRWGQAGPPKTWRRIKFWKISFSFDVETHATKFPSKLCGLLYILM